MALRFNSLAEAYVILGAKMDPLVADLGNALSAVKSTALEMEDTFTAAGKKAWAGFFESSTQTKAALSAISGQLPQLATAWEQEGVAAAESAAQTEAAWESVWASAQQASAAIVASGEAGQALIAQTVSEAEASSTAWNSVWQAAADAATMTTAGWNAAGAAAVTSAVEAEDAWESVWAQVPAGAAGAAGITAAQIEDSFATSAAAGTAEYGAMWDTYAADAVKASEVADAAVAGPSTGRQGSGFMGMGGLFAAYFLFREMSNLIGAEEAWARANIDAESTLRSLNNTTGLTSSEMRQTAADFTLLTGESQSTTLQLQTMALQMGVLPSRLNATMLSAAGLSEVTGVKLKQAVEAVTDAEQGNYSKMATLMPQIKNMGDAETRAAFIHKQLAADVDALVSKQNTWEGAMLRAKLAAEQLGHSLGKALAPVLFTVATAIGGAVVALDLLNTATHGAIMYTLVAGGAFLGLAAAVMLTTKMWTYLRPSLVLISKEILSLVGWVRALAVAVVELDGAQLMQLTGLASLWGGLMRFGAKVIEITGVVVDFAKALWAASSAQAVLEALTPGVGWAAILSGAGAAAAGIAVLGGVLYGAVKGFDALWASGTRGIDAWVATQKAALDKLSFPLEDKKATAAFSAQQRAMEKAQREAEAAMKKANSDAEREGKRAESALKKHNAEIAREAKHAAAEAKKEESEAARARRKAISEQEMLYRQQEANLRSSITEINKIRSEANSALSKSIDTEKSLLAKQASMVGFTNLEDIYKTAQVIGTKAAFEPPSANMADVAKQTSLLEKLVSLADQTLQQDKETLSVLQRKVQGLQRPVYQ